MLKYSAVIQKHVKGYLMIMKNTQYVGSSAF